MVSKKRVNLVFATVLIAGIFFVGLWAFSSVEAANLIREPENAEAVSLTSGPTFKGSLSNKSPTWNRAVSTSSPDPSCGLSLKDHANNGQAYRVIPFQVTNTSPVTVTVNGLGTTLADTVIYIYCNFNAAKPLNSGVAYDDNDGQGDLSAFLIRDNIVLATKTTYYLVISTDSAGDYGRYQLDFSSNVRLGLEDPLTCNGDTVTFDYGPPPDWQVLNNKTGNPVEWANLATCGESSNYATGHGDAACASSELQGGGSGAYDTILRSTRFSLQDVYTATLRYWVNYQNLNGEDHLVLQISTNNGGSWTTLLNWDEDHPSKGYHDTPGEYVEVDLTPYKGNSQVYLRWWYADPVGRVGDLDRYVQLDEVGLDCNIPSIELETVVSTTPGICGTEDTVSVAPGTDVHICHKATNTGGVPFALSDHGDNVWGMIIGQEFLHEPGVETWMSYTFEFNETTRITGTWTAYNPGPTDVASDTDSATVIVVPPSIVVTGTVSLIPNCSIDTKIVRVAPGTEVYRCYIVTNTGLTPFTLYHVEDSILGVVVPPDTSMLLEPGDIQIQGFNKMPFYSTTRIDMTWTAYNAGPTDVAIASDSAWVIMDATVFLPMVYK